MSDTGVHDTGTLLRLAREKSQAGRESLYKNVWDLFEQRGQSLSPAERDLMTDILRRLSVEVEKQVRQALAERLAQRDDAPRDLVTLLANDDIDVAYPILVESRMLMDIDLVEIVRQRSQAHRLAVALRENLGGTVCQAIADSGDADAVKAMINNHTAQLGEQLLSELVASSRETDAYQAPLLHRPDLPAPLARRMYVWVSAALRHHIVEHYPIHADTIDDTLSATVDAELGTDWDDPADEPLIRMVDKLAVGGELSPAFLIKALRQAQVALFEVAFARLAGVRPRLMRRLIYEPGGEALAIACRSLAIDPAVFLTVYTLTRQARNEKAPDNDDRARLQGFYESLTEEAARTVLRKWRRNHEYLAALKQLGQDA